MKTALLADLLKKVTSWNPSSQGENEFAYIDLSSVSSETKSIQRDTRIRGNEAPSRARQLLEGGDILVSTVRPNLNAVAQVPPRLDGATGSTGFTVLRPTEHLDARFLYHWVQSRPFVTEMVRRATGASYPAVSDKIVKASRVPLPPLEEQRRVAAILDQADMLRAKRRQVLAEMAALEASISAGILEGSDWSSTLEDLADVQIGPFGSLLHREDYIDGGVALINPMHIRNGALRPDPSFSVDEKMAVKLSTYRLRVGDVVMGRRGEMGRAAVVFPEHDGLLCGTGSLILRPRSGVDPTVLHAIVTAPRMRSHFERASLGATLPNLNTKIVKTAPAPLVDLQHSEKLARALGSVASQRTDVRSAIAADEELLEALRARAFRGQL